MIVLTRDTFESERETNNRCELGFSGQPGHLSSVLTEWRIALVSLELCRGE